VCLLRLVGKVIACYAVSYSHTMSRLLYRQGITVQKPRQTLVYDLQTAVQKIALHCRQVDFEIRYRDK
jgi:transposase